MIQAHASSFLPLDQRICERVCFAPDRGDGQDKAASARRVLVVEDDYLVGLQNEEALTAAGFDVVGLATNAEAAIAMAAQEKPDLVLMDIRLAQSSDGILAAIHLLEQHNIRSIFVTAHVDPGTKLRAAAAKPLGWLSKPFTEAALIKCVTDALSAKEKNEGSN